MARGQNVNWVDEPGKKVPVLYDVDVAIAGGGIAGVFAAIAAARKGATVALVDRFGIPGGNMGPGMIAGGGFHPKFGIEGSELGTYLSPSIYGDLTGIPREFIERHATYGGGSMLPYRYSYYVRDSNVASHVALEMLEEAGIQLVLSAYAADPIISQGSVVGFFLESKSGRQAITAKVSVDATGEADLARRAGIHVLHPKKEYHEMDGHSPNGSGLWAMMGGIDCDRYARGQTSSLDLEIRDIDGLGKAKIGPGLDIKWLDDSKYFDRKAGIAGMRVQLLRPVSDYDPGNGEHISRLEAGIRRFILDTVQNLRKNVPGFKDAYVLTIAPFFGTRGGPCIAGEYTLTYEDCFEGKKFDDVVYLYQYFQAAKNQLKQGNQVSWVDMPYRVMVAKDIRGLMAVGRSASSIPDTLLRNRITVLHMGQVGGEAAALAARDGVSPGEIDIRELQEGLLEAGFYLGNRKRLKELGLAP